MKIFKWCQGISFKCVMMIIVFVLFAEHTLIPNMWSYFVVKPKFYFEDFKTDQEMQAYFEKEYPVGYRASWLMYALQDRGAVCGLVKPEYYSKYKNLKSDEFAIVCTYEYGRYLINTVEISVTIIVKDRLFIDEIRCSRFSLWL